MMRSTVAPGLLQHTNHETEFVEVSQDEFDDLHPFNETDDSAK